MKLWKLAAIAASVVAASPALAQDGATIGNWKIAASPTTPTCMAIASGSENSFFGLQHSNEPAHQFMLANNKAWSQIEHGGQYAGTLTAGKAFPLTFMGVVPPGVTPTLGVAPPPGLDAALANAKSIRLQVPELSIDVSVPVSDGRKIWAALVACVPK